MDKIEARAEVNSVEATRCAKEREEDSTLKPNGIKRRIQKRINAAIKREAYSCCIYKHIHGDICNELRQDGFNVKYCFNPERTEISW